MRTPARSSFSKKRTKKLLSVFDHFVSELFAKMSKSFLLLFFKKEVLVFWSSASVIVAQALRRRRLHPERSLSNTPSAVPTWQASC
jgi:hypothetical protein